MKGGVEGIRSTGYVIVQKHWVKFELSELEKK